jgi:hypothetical protein
MLLTSLFSNVSAEIFVVCRDFLAPKHIDPKFLDPRHVFKDLSASATGDATDTGVSAGNAQTNVFQPEKKRRHRDGYADGDYTLHRKIGVANFVKSPEPISVLGAVSQLEFASEEEKGWVRLAAWPPYSEPDLRDAAGWSWMSRHLRSRPTAMTSKSWAKATSRPCSNGV